MKKSVASALDSLTHLVLDGLAPFGRFSTPAKIINIVLIVAILGVINFTLGARVGFAIFYFIPVGVASWYLGANFGLLISLLCTLLWQLAQRSAWPIEQFAVVDVWNASMRFFMFLTITVTLTRLKSSLDEANQAREAADLAAMQRTKFLDEMSHEIRTPLNVLLGMAEALEETHLETEQKQYVRTFHREGERLLTLINNLLDASKIESGHYTILSEDVDLHALCEDVMFFVGSGEQKSEVEVQLEYPQATPVAVRTDPVALRRVLLNLLTNALKFTAEGTVTVAVRKAGDWLFFEVRDTGPGIPVEKLDTIFERFRQQDGKDDIHKGGSGLGLNIVRSLTEAMGGRVEVTSQQGVGTTFLVTIPYRPAQQPVLVASEERHEDKVVRKSLRILIADDHESNRVVYKVFLKDLPWALTFVENGLEALEAMREFSFDLVLMDVQMPVMDGLEATRRIRAYEKEERRGHTPIIAVTAHAFPADVQASHDAGCDAHLAKPFRKRNLLQSIQGATSDIAETVPDVAEILGEEEHREVPRELAAFLRDYLDGARRSMTVMREAFDRGDLSTVREESHRIRGTAGSYGLNSMTRVAGQVEDAAAGGDTDGVERFLLELDMLVDRTSRSFTEGR